MKKYFLSIIMVLATAAITSCSNDDTTYYTAARAEFTIAEEAEGYEINKPIQFTDATTPEQGSTITSWLWEFGDEGGSTSTAQNPTFTYTSEGVYTVKLTVTDNHGLKANKSQNVTVLDPSKAIAVQWATAVNGSLTGGSSPAISADGTAVYLLTGGSASEVGRLNAFNTQTGGTAWILDIDAAMVAAHPTGSAAAGCKDIYSSPSVGSDGNIYFTVRDLKDSGTNRKLFVFSASAKGTVNWAYAGTDANLYAITPAIASNGDVYVAQRKGMIWKINNGVCTEYTSGIGDITGGLSLSTNGILYGTGKGNTGFFAFDTTSGTGKWIYNAEFGGAASAFTGALRSSQMSIGADGTLYAVADKTTGGMILALNTDGSLKWQYDTPTAIADGGVAIAADGTVYANLGTATDDNASGIIALNADGTLKWQYNVNASVQTTPMIDNRGYIHFIAADATYYIIKADGTLFAEQSLGEACTSAPVMDSKGNTFVTVTKDGALQMLCVTSRATSYATNAVWSMRGQNPQRTGLQK